MLITYQLFVDVLCFYINYQMTLQPRFRLRSKIYVVCLLSTELDIFPSIPPLSLPEQDCNTECEFALLYDVARYFVQPTFVYFILICLLLFRFDKVLCLIFHSRTIVKLHLNTIIVMTIVWIGFVNIIVQR